MNNVDEDLGIYYGVFSSIYGHFLNHPYACRIREQTPWIRPLSPWQHLCNSAHPNPMTQMSLKLGMNVISFKFQQQVLKMLPFGFMAFSASSLTGLDCWPRFFASQANLFWNLKTLFIKVDSWRYWTHVWKSIESPFLWPSQTQIGSGCQFLCKSSVLLQKWRGLVSR